ncbi:aspartate kinase [Fodinibius sp.]|uniref:aspartate kinase n=1 Tax=Fodinibius sp. TaxID=1872440 RepID=UPI002ACDB179|nr:aspartate kinase [Fodinibius sp.]MDZ7658628.1 aspartate kinase [Fodinibius sp.]
MRILKFGGTSMSDAKTWQQVIDIIKRYESPFVVVSATARTTRELIKAARTALVDVEEAHRIASDIKRRHKEIITVFFDEHQSEESVLDNCNKWIDQRTEELETQLEAISSEQEITEQKKDAIASIGEQLSSYLFAQCASATGIATQWIDAADIIRTDSDFGQANPDENYIANQAPSLKKLIIKGNIPVMGGYYGMDKNGQTTTLGFEGSDYSASLIGAALDAEAIEIWTDVSGIYTCDPRFVPDAQPIPQLSFQEATELAYFGAKVLHPATTKPASKKQIPIWVKNIFDPDEPGTCISSESTKNGPVKAITYKQNCTIVTVTSSQTVMGYEFLAGVFDILRWHHLAVDVVTTTEASVSIGIENGDNLDNAIEQLNSYGSVEILNNQGIISLVGCSNENSLVTDILSKVKNVPQNLISYSKFKGNLNIVVDEDQVLPVVKDIHQKLFS